MTQNYEIVLVTRNRPEILCETLPRFVCQDRQPSRLIIVDSSDDERGIESAIAAAGSANPTVPVEVVRSPPGMTRQRNIGLGLVQEPVVVFPDDDSVWYRNTAQELLRIYELDSEERVGGVCGRDASRAPAFSSRAGWGVLERSVAPVGYSLRQSLLRSWTKKGNPGSVDPFRTLGDGFASAADLPAALQGQSCVLVPWMTGYRMSFRTRVIREVGFCELMSEYSLFEDVLASMQVWTRGYLLVGANEALVEHRRAPGRRGDGFRMGAMQVLNRAYILAKCAPEGDLARESFGRWYGRKVLSYGLRPWSRYRLRRLSGAVWARSYSMDLLAARPERVDALFAESTALIGRHC